MLISMLQVLLHVSPAVGGVPFNTIMQQCPANLKVIHWHAHVYTPDMPCVVQDKGIFNTLASELVDNDEDYLAIVLQEIAERFTVQELDDSIIKSQEAAVCATDPTPILQ